MKTLKSWKIRVVVLFCVGTLTGCGTLFVPDSSCWNDFSPWGETPEGKVNLAQCWDHQEQRRFYTTTQGSHIAPYDIATNIEWHDKAELFLSPETIEHFGYLVSDYTSPWPVGWVKDSVKSGDFKGNWIGMTCAACHTSEIEYQGKTMRIDGGSTLADFTGFINAFDQSLEATYSDVPPKDGGPSGPKFDRLAQRLSNLSTQELRDLLEIAVVKRRAWRKRNNPPQEGQPGFAGYARLDAFGVIFNEVTQKLLGHPKKYHIPADFHEPNAPVSYPFLWDTHFHDWTQWNGISPAVPMGRNVGQVIGVFGEVNMKKKTTSIRLKNLRKLQGLVKKLRSPVWPKSILGGIDQDKADKGKKLFEQHCESCHAIQKRNEHLDDLDVNMTLLTPSKPDGIAIGTDPKMATNASRYVVNSLESGEQVPASEQLGEVAFTAVFTKSMELIRFFIDGISAFLDHFTLTQPTPLAYKGRPLDGIWATAPYLHNGSVPNLYELLLPEEERTEQFCVGIKKFDPQKVGFITEKECPSGVVGTELDTTLEGNWNTGHTEDIYGVKFTDEQRWQLVEYQKTL